MSKFFFWPKPDNPRSRVVAGIALWCIPLILIFVIWLGSYAFSRGPQVPSSNVVVNIPKGATLQGIAAVLTSKGIIKEDFRFFLVAKISRYAGALQAGEFQLETGKTPLEVLKNLANAKPLQHAITIPEGLRASDIAAIFSEGGWFDPRSFANLLVDKEFIAKQGLAGVDSLEGYLFPDTYLLVRDSRGAEKIMGLMVGRFNKVWQELTVRMKEPPNRAQTVILASMVEKETAVASERPLIAGVFFNRLRLGMRLQSDPTVSFGLSKHLGAITRTDLQTPTLYNTYTLPGLPVGPICSPGKDSLLAVLSPTPTKDLYFVAKNDGSHQFSATLAEHNLAVQKYQRKKNGEQGK